ncbi:hypothetical protein TNCV_1354701 [Trichonephila clavipes]|uniref:Uncharacterized protein n=1 Tax=Trichonephila clavipes TaxID=2585209 RepID=A0A8X6SAY6_TRICX|nr:hypothetical protein TNCV_1354701 [Trichonephila clavipes]
MAKRIFSFFAVIWGEAFGLFMRSAGERDASIHRAEAGMINSLSKLPEGAAIDHALDENVNTRIYKCSSQLRNIKNPPSK